MKVIDALNFIIFLTYSILALIFGLSGVVNMDGTFVILGFIFLVLVYLMNINDKLKRIEEKL